jgi:hypothetical protein
MTENSINPVGVGAADFSEAAPAKETFIRAHHDCGYSERGIGAAA